MIYQQPPAVNSAKSDSFKSGNYEVETDRESITAEIDQFDEER